MSFLSSLAGLFKPSAKPEEPPAEAGSADPVSVSVEEVVPLIEPSTDDRENCAHVARIMFGFVELSPEERKAVDEIIKDGRFLFSPEARDRVFFGLNLQGRFHWSEWDYWRDRLGEDRLAELSPTANYFLSGHEEDAWAFEPAGPYSRESLETRSFSIQTFKDACESVGIEPSFTRRWASVLKFFDALSPEQQSAALAACASIEQSRRDKWRKEHPEAKPKKGDYWLFVSFCLAMSARVRALKTKRANLATKDRYYNASEEETRDWQSDAHCPWQESYGPKNPFGFFQASLDLPEAE